MRKLLPLVLLAACSSGPSKQDASRVFASAMTSMVSAQSSAVTAAHGGAALNAPAALNLQYNGSCPAGGTVAVSGSYDDSGNGMDAAFDLDTSFTGCKDIAGTLDGDLHWTSSASATGFTSAMTGSLTWSDAQDSATCDFDLHLSVSGQAVSYTGSVCGYDVTELGH